MKDSGIEWIGKIPENWECRKLKTFVQLISKGATPSEMSLESSEKFKVMFVKGENIINGYLSYEKINYITEDDNNKQIRSQLKKDDILYVIAGSIGKCGIVSELLGKTNINQAIAFIRLQDKYMFLNKYLYLYFQSDYSILYSKLNTVKSALPNLSMEDLGNMYITLPKEKSSIIEISAHLDNQCAHIDNIIEKTKASIEEYKKLRQAVITQAVTKGVRGDRPMKDSGIEWIGEIPEEWETSKVRYIGTLQNGISKGGEYFGEGFPFVSYGDVYKNYVIPQNVNGLVRTTEDERKQYSVIAGDIFFTRTSETIEEVGFTAVCEKTIENATFAGFVIRLRPFEAERIITTGYAKYYFRGEQIRKYLVKEMNLVTRASLGQGLLNAMTVLVPPKNEQQEIAIYLDKKCAEIDSLISKKEQFLTELESYKKSMIYEYVTGKKEVPTA